MCVRWFSQSCFQKDGQVDKTSGYHWYITGPKSKPMAQRSSSTLPMSHNMNVRHALSCSLVHVQKAAAAHFARKQLLLFGLQSSANQHESGLSSRQVNFCRPTAGGKLNPRAIWIIEWKHANYKSANGTRGWARSALGEPLGSDRQRPRTTGAGGWNVSRVKNNHTSTPRAAQKSRLPEEVFFWETVRVLGQGFNIMIRVWG